MAKTKKPEFGELPPQYSFVLNPYPDMRISRCPFCEHKTGQPKAIADILPYTRSFGEYYKELRVTRPGWYGKAKATHDGTAVVAGVGEI